LFEGEFGKFSLVLVGALNVGSIATVWAGDIAPAARRVVTAIASPALELDKGAELGRFNMGSTVILLFEAGRVRWLPQIARGAQVKCGEPLGSGS
jgi:phosphatidylserine decarboxylase